MPWEHIQLNIHVDDISVTLEADTPNKAADELQRVDAHLVASFECGLDLPFDPRMTVLVPNDKWTVELVALRLCGSAFNALWLRCHGAAARAAHMPSNMGVAGTQVATRRC